MDGLATLEEVLHIAPGSLGEEQPLREIPEWDSLAVLEFMAFADERFGVTLRPEQFRTCRTVQDIVSLLKK